MSHLMRRYRPAVLALCLALPALVIAMPPSPTLQPPAELQALNPLELQHRLDRKDGEARWSARLADGGWLRVETRGDGRLKKVKTDGRSAVPAALLSRLLPPAALRAPQLARLNLVTEVERDSDGEIEVQGREASGRTVEITFAPDGRVLEVERSFFERRRFSVDEVRNRLEQAGYTQLGWIDIDDDDEAEALATNAHGERVEVRLNRRGQVDRERHYER